MALGITATPTDDTHSPYVTISVTGLTVGVDYTVTRIDNSGEYSTVAVRGMDTIEATASTAAGTDYEAPIGRSLKYRITQSAASADSSNVELTYVTIGDCWIRSVSTPSLSRKVVMNEWPDTSHTTSVLANVKVLGRKNPVMITDTWGTRQGSFVIVTDNDDGLGSTTWQEIVALLTGGGTLLLQTTGRGRTGQEDMYFEVEGYTRTRVGPLKSSTKHVYLHTIGYQEVDRPATIEESLGLRSYADVLDEADTTIISDTFTRSVTDGLGAADTGQSYQIIDGTAANFDVSATFGTIALTAANDVHIGAILTGVTDFDVKIKIFVNVATPSGASIGKWAIGRLTDASNYYVGAIEVNTSGNVFAVIKKRVAGTLSDVGSSVQVDTGHTSNEIWWIRFKGNSSTLKMKAWLDSGAEPEDWTVEQTDASLSTGQYHGFGAFRHSGNTNSCVVTVDNLTVTDSASYQDILDNYSTYLALLIYSYPPGG